MKKMMLVLLIVLTLNQQVFAFDNVEDSCFEIVETIVSENVSRKECLIAIMKVLGVDDTIARDKRQFMIFAPPLFRDLDPILDEDGYINIALHNYIACGEIDLYDEPQFYPRRPVTVKECLAFMLRCLSDPKNQSWDDVFQDALTENLLTESEFDTIKETDLLTRTAFKAYLARMLAHKRYLYAPPKMRRSEWDFSIDETESRYVDNWNADVLIPLSFSQ